MGIPQYFVRKTGTNYNLVSFSFERVNNQSVDQTPFTTSKSTGGVLNIGDDVSIGYMDGAVFVEDFSGDIVEKSLNETASFVLESYGGRLNRAEHFSQIYSGKSPEFIVEDIINNQVSSLTYSSSNVSGIVISEFVIKDETPGEAIGRIVELLKWQIRTDNSKNFYFEPLGNTVNSTNLVLGSNAHLVSDWNYVPGSIINFITFKGGNAVFDTNETFTAIASQTTFTVSSVMSGNVKVTDNGTEMVGGVDGSTTTFDYELSSDGKDVVFSVGRTVGHTIIVYYSYDVPIKITGKNSSSISSNGLFSRKIIEKNVVTMNDARRRVKQILSLYGELSRSGVLLVDYGSSFVSGETVVVSDSFNGVNLSLVIYKSVLKYPEGEKLLSVGTARIDLFDWRKGIDSRLRRLEAGDDNSDRIQQFRSFVESVNVKVSTGRLRVRTDSIGNSFILGSSTNGILGINTGTANGLQQVLGSAGRVETLVSVSLKDNLMTENFSSTQYKDSASTTATWNIVSGLCSFTLGQIAQSSTVYKDTVKTKAKISVSDTTNLSASLSMDGGSNWESVSFDSWHTFTNTGNELLWKLTASGVASTNYVQITIG